MRRRHLSVAKPTAQINITSLLDITFVLLISFMVVAPAMMRGVDIDLPKVKDAPTLKSEKPIAVTVPYRPESPEVRVDGRIVGLDDLVTSIRDRSDSALDPIVTLEGDGRVDWELMTKVIAELRTGGIVNIGILTEVEAKS